MSKDKRSLNEDSYLNLLTILIPLILLSLLAIYIVWSNVAEIQQQISWDRFDSRVEQTNNIIQNELKGVENLLIATHSYYQADESIEASEWDNFVENLYLDENFAGVSSLGLVEKVDPEGLDEFLDEASENYSDLLDRQTIEANIMPAEEYYLLKFISPTSDNRVEVIGNNLGAEHERLRTITESKDSGEISLTSEISLDATDEAGFIMFIPIMTGEEINNLIAASFRSNDFFQELMNKTKIDNGVSLSVYEKSSKPQNLLYKLDNGDAGNLMVSKSVNFGNREWIFEYSAIDNFGLSSQDLSFPYLSAFITGIICLLLVIFLTYLIRERTLAIGKIKATKSELSITEDKFRTIFENTSHFLAILNAESEILDVNNSVLRMAGETQKGNFIGKKIWELSFLNNNERSVAKLKELLNLSKDSGKPVSGEVTLDVGGKKPIIDFTITPIMDENGDVSLLVPEGLDISARLDYQLDLQIRNNQLEELNKVMVDRELKMIAMKEKLKELGIDPTEVI